MRHSACRVRSRAVELRRPECTFEIGRLTRDARGGLLDLSPCTELATFLGTAADIAIDCVVGRGIKPVTLGQAVARASRRADVPRQAGLPSRGRCSRGQMRAELERLPPGSSGYAELSARYDLTTAVIVKRARRAWARQS
jgi:hypothetical protein